MRGYVLPFPVVKLEAEEFVTPLYGYPHIKVLQCHFETSIGNVQPFLSWKPAQPKTRIQTLGATQILVLSYLVIAYKTQKTAPEEAA